MTIQHFLLPLLALTFLVTNLVGLYFTIQRNRYYKRKLDYYRSTKSGETPVT